MNLKKKLYKWALLNIVKKLAPESFSLSSDEAKNNNFYWINICDGNLPIANLVKYENDRCTFVKFREGNEDLTFIEYTLNQVIESKVVIHHFYGYAHVKFDSFYDFLWRKFFPILYIKLKVKSHLDSATQILFNRKSIKVKKRYEYLKHLVETYGIPNKEFSEIEFINSLYTFRIFSHPNYEVESRRLISILESFIDTQELRKINHHYQITGFAFKALSDFEIEQRKHKELTSTQGKLVLLTFILALVALVQSEIIRVPTLLDFTNTHETAK